jgi:hypothetical protein
MAEKIYIYGGEHIFKSSYLPLSHTQQLLAATLLMHFVQTFLSDGGGGNLLFS